MIEKIPIWSMLPFILMLASIAVFPLFAGRFWDKNKNKLIIALILGIPTIIWLLSSNLSSELYHTMVFDYIPFLILLGALFVITGGIFVDGDIEAKPIANTTFLAIGAVLASFMGTTGAAMLLIRPLIHTNKRRELKTHTILFFIGIVANCGGMLTPLGDPPLFMMYLRGAPFTWFLKLAPEWLFVNAMLLIIYFFADTYFWGKESLESKRREHEYKRPIKIEGKLNFIWLLGVIIAVALINPNTFPSLGNNPYLSFIREAVIILMALLSFQFTTHLTRTSNSFSWHPIEEVAYLFLGIFITMVPCLLYLENNAELLGITNHTLFYYATGGLSSFLDNTPTAVTFYSLAKGLVEQEPNLFKNVQFVAGIPEILMKAISVGAVFFGSMTYIGNGPNFMVKSIAEHSNIRMPHFFAYMFKFSLIILLPLFIICELLFL
ncbi:MAG: sodium:proton antiporter [Ignavibacteriae bacterium]|nr:sodium:proton antiporter [Ignavibacteriota bacterium]